ncbi:trypco2 family protein [Sphaerisporangium viridialbum]|uniref:trypco2 family protein n=1 Tax=Sphaerisporangium viridialbum TaxID=46189 RepID=UPI003C78ACBB
MEIELADAVQAVRDELLEAAVRGLGSEIAFTVGPIELEFTVELKADAKAKFGFKAWVVTGDAEAGVSRGRTHKVKLTLTPKHADGTDLLIAGDPAVADGPGEVSGTFHR